MPNHVTNRIKITGDRESVLRFFNQAKVGDDEFSFAGFIPTPDDYIDGNCSHDHYNYRLGKKEGPDPYANCWYSWNITNWGTKWGAYDVFVDKPFNLLDALACDGIVTGSVRFDTAWSPPVPVYEKIIELFPDCTLEFSFMDEDMQGSGGGVIRYAPGGELEETYDVNDPDTPLWWELAGDLKGYTKEQHEVYLAEVAEDERLAAERAE